ncbi:MAG: sn-glycerol-1-phosphate dehydrogenase [bacterium]
MERNHGRYYYCPSASLNSAFISSEELCARICHAGGKVVYMNQFNQKLAIPSLLGKTIPCTCGVKHVIPTQDVIIKEGAIENIATCCECHLPGKRILLVVDKITWSVVGKQVTEILKKAGYIVEVLFMQTSANGSVVADDQNVEYVRAAIHPSIDFLIAVGSGTINDVVKLASYQSGRRYLVCPTAPSMNGYTSSIAAIMSQGIKYTIPAHSPVVVVADLQILAAAPAAMRLAGLGDLISKPVSNADWKLAHLIKGDYYCEWPLRIVKEVEVACRSHAAAIGSGEMKAIRILTEALILSGFSMVVAGSSSPASGGEHLISHYWDMTAQWYEREEKLHGAQVGVATLLTSKLFEKLQQLDPKKINIATLCDHYLDWKSQERKLRKIHGPLDSEVVIVAKKKYLTLKEKEKEWAFIIENWQVIWQQLSPILIPSAEIRKILLKAEAPTTIRKLGISAEELRKAFLYAKDIRDRYTVLDFAHDLGVLESLCDEILTESGVLD